MNLLETIKTSPRPVTWGYLRQLDPQLDTDAMWQQINTLEAEEKIERDESNVLVTKFRLKKRSNKREITKSVWVSGWGIITCEDCGKETKQNAGNQKVCPDCSPARKQRQREMAEARRTR